MFPAFTLLRHMLRGIIANKDEQGHVVKGLFDELDRLPDSYDALNAFAHKLASLPLRDQWPYSEPSELDEIWAECDPSRPGGVIGVVDLNDSAKRVTAAFLGSVCGCVLGKPLEFNPTLEDIRAAASACGEWPLNNYVSERLLDAIGKRHPSWIETERSHIRYVAPDDDINYTIMGMLVLEEHGVGFTKQQLKDEWLHRLTITNTWGPERTMLIKAGADALMYGQSTPDLQSWVEVWNPGDEQCGATIRADAYGYACPGRPALAAELAWRDASWTHRRTGIYGTMYVAAVIALAQVTQDRLSIFDTALKFVPQRSRFYRVVTDCLNDVAQASDWLDGYQRIHDKYQEYSHCRVYQEIGTLINTLRFAENVGDGICKQVSQGNDTDSFGATAGSILGAYFGPGHLEPRWLRPFNDEIHTFLGSFYEHSLSALAQRMSRLPALVTAQLPDHSSAHPRT
ncbi:MAG: ADP-ribosylglycohydrolase family protein [Chloroflexi bacterium]|nr:ADP-ribosylglycohydrolase family protein [Chloroflexota bacterium]